jgi:hypothetical protein
VIELRLEREADGQVNSFLDKNTLEYFISNARSTRGFVMEAQPE